MHPKSVPSTFLLGAGYLPQELIMEITDSPDKQIVKANGIPRGCMSLPQGPPLHLLRQSWGPNRLLLDISWQSRWILKQRWDADFEVYAKRIWHSAHLIKYLEAFMPNDGHKSQSNKVQDNTCNVTAQKGVITRHFHNMAQTNVTSGQDGMIARHSHLNGRVWLDQSNQSKGTKEVS